MTNERVPPSEQEHQSKTWVYLGLAEMVDHQHADEIQQHTERLEGDDSQP